LYTISQKHELTQPSLLDKVSYPNAARIYFMINPSELLTEIFCLTGHFIMHYG